MATAEPDEALIAAVRAALLRLAREGRTGDLSGTGRARAGAAAL